MNRATWIRACLKTPHSVRGLETGSKASPLSVDKLDFNPFSLFLEEFEMRVQTILSLLVATALVLPQLAAAKPPAHAPAHGYRAKQKAPEPAPRKAGLEIVYDSERGIHVAVGLPDIFFHDGRYYRQHDGRWEISLSGDGGWRVSVSSEIPVSVVDARKKSHPGPAKRKPGRRK